MAGQYTPEQQAAVIQRMQEEVQAKAMQELVTQMTDQCFTRCAKTRGDRLDTSEQGCLAMCMDRITPLNVRRVVHFMSSTHQAGSGLAVVRFLSAEDCVHKVEGGAMTPAVVVLQRAGKIDCTGQRPQSVAHLEISFGERVTGETEQSHSKSLWSPVGARARHLILSDDRPMRRRTELSHVCKRKSELKYMDTMGAVNKAMVTKSQR